MSDAPSTPPNPDDPQDPWAAMFGGPLPPELREQLESMGLGEVDPAMLQAAQSQLQAMMAADDGSPVNATVAHDTARALVASRGDQSVGDGTRRDVQQVVQVATLWLDAVTDLAPPEGGARALSRAEWVEATLPAWRVLTEPVAVGVAEAISSAMSDQVDQLGDAEDISAAVPGLPPGMDVRALIGQATGMIRRMSAAMFGAQVGQAVGTLAGDTVSGTEVGLPLLPGEVVAMLPLNVASFAEGLGIDAGEVHLYLAVREAARVRLFAGVGWLGPQLMTAVQDYARDITLDTDGIEAAIRDVDPSDPQALQEALGGTLFAPEPSPAQRAALSRLETYLALVEGWVDLVTARAVAPHLPHAEALGEAVRRRRASGGPAEKVFASLVGLELRPRRLRDAANLWAALDEAHGQSRRDEVWSHPDLAPTAGDLDDPLGFVERRAPGQAGGSAMDDELAKLLDDAGRADGEPDPGR